MPRAKLASEKLHVRILNFAVVVYVREEGLTCIVGLELPEMLCTKLATEKLHVRILVVDSAMHPLKAASLHGKHSRRKPVASGSAPSR